MRRVLPLSFLLACFAALSPCASSQTPTPSSNGVIPVIDGIPGPLTWQHPPVQWKIEGDTLTITAPKATNWYSSPGEPRHWDSSPRLLFKPAPDFVLSAKVSVGMHSSWDAGELVVYSNEGLWAKFGVEKIPDNGPTLVSVVTRGISDDNNSIVMSGPVAYLKVARNGTGIFFYASEDGQDWKEIRGFTLGEVPDLLIGFASQSPVGEGCTAVFSHIQYLTKKVDLWTGK